MNHKVLAFISRTKMIPAGSHVICAVSGGKDSMALLHLMCALRDELSITVSVAHYNHRLRGDESLRDAAFVQEFCHTHSIPLSIGEGNVAFYAQTNHIGTEEAARILRYEFFDTLPEKALIATAHNADDNLETVLMHMLRGSGLHGLTGIPPVRGRYIRPLLCVDRSEIEEYLSTQSIPNIEDSSNADDFCLRNRLRHHVIPLLKEENPRAAVTVSAMCARLRQDDRYLSEVAGQATPIQDGMLHIPALLALPEAISRRSMQKYLAPVPQLFAEHIEAAFQLCTSASPSAKLSLPGGYTLTRVYDALRLTASAPASLSDSVPLVPDSDIRFGVWQVRCRRAICPPALPPHTVALIEGTYTIRCRQPGDRFTHSGGTKKLSQYLIDRKIPAHMRDTLPILVSQDTVAAILPFLASKNYAGTPGSPCLLLEVKHLEEFPL